VIAQADARGLAVHDGPKTKLTPNWMPEISTCRPQHPQPVHIWHRTRASAHGQPDGPSDLIGLERT
jgi:hypothetical protein